MAKAQAIGSKSTVAGHRVACTLHGVLWVQTATGQISVLPNGTHAALDVLGPQAKHEIVRWWRKARRANV